MGVFVCDVCVCVGMFDVIYPNYSSIPTDVFPISYTEHLICSTCYLNFMNAIQISNLVIRMIKIILFKTDITLFETVSIRY